MSSKPGALPIFGDAYLADTTHLTTEEHGAYFLLMLAAWRQDDCGLPDDPVKLARIAGLSLRKWKAGTGDVVMAFWHQAGGRWFQKRLSETRQFVDERSAKQADRRRGKGNQKPHEPNLFDATLANDSNSGRDNADKIVRAQGDQGIENKQSDINRGGTSQSQSQNEPKGSYPPIIPPALLQSWPDWLPIEAWNGFVDMRKAIKKPLTPRAVSLALKELDKLRREGCCPEAVLDQSTFKNWQGLFAPKDGDRDNAGFQGNRGFAARGGNQGDGFAQALDRSIASNRNGEVQGEAERQQACAGGGGGEQPSAQIITLPSRGIL